MLYKYFIASVNNFVCYNLASNIQKEEFYMNS